MIFLYLIPGSSADGAEVPIEIESPEIESPEVEGMDVSSELFQHYIPPTFSRLPPDGDEFPKSWADERNSSKTYRSELNLKDMMVFGSPPPPPIPMSEPPSEEETQPPPLPATVPHPPPPPPPPQRRRTN